MSNIKILAALATYINTGAAASGRVAATTMVPVPKVRPARGFESYGKQAAELESELKQHHLDAASASDSPSPTDCLRVKTVVRCPICPGHWQCHWHCDWWKWKCMTGSRGR